MTHGLEARLEVRRPSGFALELSLRVPAGRTVALLGPNGAGKSTTLAILAGLLPLDRGAVELGGRVLDAPDRDLFVDPRDRQVGVVFQDGLLFPHLTVLDNVAFGLRSRGRGREEAGRRAHAWLERLGLGGLAERRPVELSGGQAQLVALARALVTEPQLLLLDEPLSALDVTVRARLRRVLREHLDAFPGPRLLITHDPSEAFELADEVHILEDGRVTQVGTPQEIRMRPRTPYAADVGGANLVPGIAGGGSVDTGELELAISDPEMEGPVRLSIRPNAISVHRERPGGSPRNRWRTTVERFHDDGFRVRMLAGSPLPLMVELTHAALEELGLEPGVEIWLSVKATEIGVEPEDGVEGG